MLDWRLKGGNQVWNFKWRFRNVIKFDEMGIQWALKMGFGVIFREVSDAFRS